MPTSSSPVRNGRANSTPALEVLHVRRDAARSGDGRNNLSDHTLPFQRSVPAVVRAVGIILPIEMIGIVGIEVITWPAEGQVPEAAVQGVGARRSDAQDKGRDGQSGDAQCFGGIHFELPIFAVHTWLHC